MRRALTGPLSFGLSKAIASPEGVGVGLFDLLVNGNRIFINSQALRVTKNGD
jgi:hypothetical protein